MQSAAVSAGFERKCFCQVTRAIPRMFFVWTLALPAGMGYGTGVEPLVRLTPGAQRHQYHNAKQEQRRQHRINGIFTSCTSTTGRRLNTKQAAGVKP